jgi:hypothetical protein
MSSAKGWWWRALRLLNVLRERAHSILKGLIVFGFLLNGLGDILHDAAHGLIREGIGGVSNVRRTRVRVFFDRSLLHPELSEQTSALLQYLPHLLAVLLRRLPSAA